MKNNKLFFLFFLLLISCGESAESLVQKAMILENQEKYSEAIKILDKAIDNNPNHLGAYINRGADKSALGKHLEAIEDYEIVLKKDSSNELAMFNIANNFKKLNKYKQAVFYYNRILKDTSSSALISNSYYRNENLFSVPKNKVYFERGKANYELNRYENAFHDFNNSFVENDTNGEKYYLLGASYYMLGDKDNACIAFRQAIYWGYNYAKKEFNKNCDY